MSPSAALVKRQDADVALMPPPPVKRTKRPATVLDEDDYTNALSDIIARDYFPGVAEAKAQEEYLTALESKNSVWIREAGQRLREAVTPLPKSKTPARSRDARFDTPRSCTNKTPLPDTPRGANTPGSETPLSTGWSEVAEENAAQPQVDTSTLSLTSFQAKYTSEDNESFNTLLDKQNNNRRKKHRYLWTSDQRIPGDRLIAHRAQQSALIEAKADHEALAKKHNEQALVPMSTGAISSRPASVDSWKAKTPNNSLMFAPDGVEDSGLQTVMEAKEAASKAGPKETVFANTRFPPSYLLANNDDDTSHPSIPPSPSLNTTIIAARDARRALNISSSASSATDFPSSTPRVNGYSFVDEDESPPPPPQAQEEPSYRDLLAGQASTDGKPNPFTISEIRRREDLHLRLVARDQAGKRNREKESERERGNMTPAARRLMSRLGRTPTPQRSGVIGEGSGGGKEIWTPATTPRRMNKSTGTPVGRGKVTM